MNEPFVIEIDERGVIRCLGNPLGLPGRLVAKTRYSEIVPIRSVLRVAFRLIRWVFGDNGKMAAWTRRWPCDWQATILDTGETARSNSRQALIEWERGMYNAPKCDL